MASRSSHRLWPIVTAACGILVFIIALPQEWKNGWAPSFLNPSLHLGLDLAGGTQLDFRISEHEIEDQLATIDAEIAALEAADGSGERIAALRLEKQVLNEQRQNLVEAIRTVLERRINALGVSEATITPSYIGGEKHLLVECPGVVDVQQCIKTVGKTIQLEFKEEFTEASAEYEQSVRTKVQETVRKVRESGATLATLGEDLGDDLGMGYDPSNWFFRDELPPGLENLWGATPGSGILQREGSVKTMVQDDQGQPKPEEIKGIYLVEMLTGKTMTGRTIEEAPVAFEIIANTQENVTQRLERDRVLDEKLPVRVISALRSLQPGNLTVVSLEDGTALLVFLRSFTAGREEVNVSHILVAYKGASAAPADVTRTKEEALARATELKAKLDQGTAFELVARTDSDGPSKRSDGLLGSITRGQLVPSFEEVAFTQVPGVVSDPVETPFGYHLIRVNSTPTQTSDRATFDALTFTGADAELRAQATLADLQAGKIQRQEEAIELRTLFFSLKPTGWKDTQLDGKHFRTASVTLDPTTNIPVVQIMFDPEGATIFQELTKRNIGKRIAIFVGGELVSAPTVQSEIAGGTAVISGSQNFEEARLLAQDLNTGAIPAPIYLNGQRTVEATLGAQALETSVLAGIWGMVVVMLYMLIAYRFLGVLANFALTIYATLFVALMKLPLFLFSDQYVVLTLAGAAGMILSIGMAVDTNVLVFERVKEELKKGKLLKTAVELGFEKAWPSIRDSNISTIITCVLLFMIGTSIVRGFAVTLGLGVVISMFTGMIITRWLARRLAELPILQRPWLFPGTQNTTKNS